MSTSINTNSQHQQQQQMALPQQEGYPTEMTAPPGYPEGMVPQAGYPGGAAPQPGYPIHSASQQQVVVIMNQPQAQTRQGPRPWRTSLFGCFEDMGICMLVTFCSECAVHKLLHNMGESACLPYCMPNFLVPVRTRLRSQLNIEGSICNDCVTTHCCWACALCQLMIEHKKAREAGEL